VLDRLYKWNPDGKPDDSFEMDGPRSGSLPEGYERPLLLVDFYPPDDLLRCFRHHKVLPVFHALPPPQPKKTFTLTLLEGFKGYDACRPDITQHPRMHHP
jgi:hypothetical protein